MTGTATAFLDASETVFSGLKMLGNVSAYRLTVTVTQSGQQSSSSALISGGAAIGPITASAVVRIDECALTESFDNVSKTCVCIANSMRNSDGVCECTEGSHTVYVERDKRSACAGEPCLPRSPAEPA